MCKLFLKGVDHMSKKGFPTGTLKTMPGLQEQSRRQSSFSSAVLGKRNTVVDQLKMEMDAYETIIKNAEKRLEDAPE